MQTLEQAIVQAQARGVALRMPRTAAQLDAVLVALWQQGIRHNLEDEACTREALAQHRATVHATAQAAIRKASHAAH